MIYGQNILENMMISGPDIMYNKDKFDSGEINLAFIIGHSGSGKTTMATEYESTGVDQAGLDDVTHNWNYSDENLKEYGNLISSYFKQVGPHIRYYSREEYDNDSFWDGAKDIKDCYEYKVSKDFIAFAKQYARNHKDKRFIVEGVHILLFSPEDFKDCAVFIKGTSMIKSKIRAVNRDSKNKGRFTFNRAMHYYIDDEKRLKAFRNYFKDK